MDPLPTPPDSQIPTPQNIGAPVKYIRTFETDMKTVQAKGVPDLAPLDETPPPEVSEPIPEPPPQPEAEPQPAQEVTLPPEPPRVLELERDLPAPPPTPPPGLPELEKPSPIETYTSDFADRLKETGASTASVIAAEQDAGTTPGTGTPPEPPKGNRLYIIGGAVLILLGAVGAYIAYVRYTGATTPVIILSTASAPIFVDDRVLVSGTGAALLREVEQSVADTLAFNSVRLLYASSTADKTIFAMLDISAPSVLLRNISVEGSMVGVVNVGGVQSPFFILSVTTYGSTFSGMLSWEAVMPRTLAGLYPAYPTPVVAIPVVAPIATTTATSTQKSTKTTTKQKTATATTATSTPPAPVVFVGFRDEVVANHDVRIYRDAKSRSVMLYGYWNQTTLIIARDPAAFTEILQRLATSHT